ncbi:TetR/AcrR family transcriptional regulator [Streptomyces tubbatahanensis]|uniref:TetR/AcrR family transcriptional regulator n=1 Tax=Streptomyces tubbatahanensis TaxID=2923272 RepID=A0ABY3XT94_9ACTN|nr:TetR/AcrR family transcriptional regulator [Streptomyces tubbatahanensis]UNS97635.1 TetR/AcrR family transcriptional regulator [Streptomyces tubbatahanensis]
MARPRLFDEERALDAAMRAFWEKGYEATSTQDLCEATGLGRSSIYNTFTSKHALFRRSLARYVETMTALQLEIVEDAERPALERFEALFACIVEQEFAQRRDGRSIGCLSVNTTVELAARDPDVADVLARDVGLRLAALRAAVEAGQRAGEIPSAQAPAELARFVNAVIAGMRVSAQGGADRAALEGIAATAVAALRA